MSWFTSAEKSRTGVILDIGSGSAGIAIVHSQPGTSAPQIVWHHREHMPITAAASLTDIRKRLGTAIMNTFLALGNSGIPTLTASDYRSTIDQLQVSITAPWSYTITKTVSYSDDTPFAVDAAFITDLSETAQRRVQEELENNDTLASLGLEIIAENTTNLTANGYRITRAAGQSVQKVSLAHVSSVAQARLTKQLHEAADRVIPETPTELHSFMLLYHCVARHLTPEATELCLVDVTREATEVGIVRDGQLRYVTHLPFGSYALAREIATALHVSHEEAFAYLKDGNETMYDDLDAEKQTEITSIMKSFRQQLTDLLGRTGDRLSIPKIIYLHVNAQVETFFHTQIKKSAVAATNSNHTVRPINHMLLRHTARDLSPDESSLLLTAFFFHKIRSCAEFEHA